MTIRTARLELIPADAPILRAVVEGAGSLSDLLGVNVPEGWPEYPESYRHALAVFERDPSILPWWTHVFVDRAAGALVGSGGYSGPPTPEGVVEIGYEIAPAYRGRGLATEAAFALMSFAFEHPEVRVVEAHTLAMVNASTRVLEKIGMVFSGAQDDPAEGIVWVWRAEMGSGPDSAL